jgi:acetolactate synthase-1/2/3 large subunit
MITTQLRTRNHAQQAQALDIAPAPRLSQAVGASHGEISSHPRPRQTRAADRMAALLAEQGVEHVFGLPGGPIAPLNDALMDVSSIRSIAMRHENSAMFAAAGYARTSGKLGVVALTSGPGILNGMTGLASAYCDGLPLLVLVGEVPRSLHGKNALQDGDHLGIRNILGAVTKWTAEVPDANAAVPMLQRAIQIAMSGRRGPVALILPMDVLAGPARDTCTAVVETRDMRIPGQRMDSVVRAIQASATGVIFVGAGARNQGGSIPLRALAEQLQWPVMTTPKGKGVFPESHPLSLGVFGMGGHPSAQRYMQQGVDTILAIGTSLGDLATNGWSPLLRPRQTLIHVDIDIAQIGRNYAADLSVAAPAALFMRELCKRLPARPVGDQEEAHGVMRYEDPEQLGNGPEGRIAPPRAIWEIQRLMPENTIFVIDSGEHFFFATHYLQIERPDAFVVMTGLGSMGSSISALGIKQARPHRPVAVICGDGGFAMMAPDIATATQYDMEIAFFVLNDERLGMVERGNNRIYGRTPSYATTPLKVPRMARSLGARATTVVHAGELVSLGLNTLLRKKPLVVDVRIDRHVTMPHNQRLATLSNVVHPPPGGWTSGDL